MVLWNFFIHFLNHFAKIYDRLKFYTFDIHSPWPAVAAMARGGFSTYRRGPRRLGCHRGVRSATGGMEWPSNRRRPRRLHVAQQPP
jgi:hypothetical protein